MPGWGSRRSRLLYDLFATTPVAAVDLFGMALVSCVACLGLNLGMMFVLYNRIGMEIRASTGNSRIVTCT